MLGEEKYSWGEKKNVLSLYRGKISWHQKTFLWKSLFYAQRMDETCIFWELPKSGVKSAQLEHFLSRTEKMFNQERQKKERYYHEQKKRHPFFSEARVRLAALNFFVEGRLVRLNYSCVTRCLTNHGFLASLSSRTNPELPTEILFCWKKGAVSFARDSI